MNKIGWCDKTINPVVGCNIGCDYCYARRQAKRQKQNCILCYKYKPHEHLERLKQLTPRQKPMKVFIDSMWDWNSPGVKPEWCRQIIAKMTECSQHIFLILSKKPEEYRQFNYPENVWLGTTVTGDEDADRLDELRYFKNNTGRNVFVSVEPLLKHLNIWSIRGMDWVIIGALSRVGKPPLQPESSWVTGLVDIADKYSIPVYTKDNLTVGDVRKDFPKAMKHTIRKVA